MKRRYLLCSILIVALMIGTSFSILPSIGSLKEQTQKATISAYTIHAPICIRSNGDFVTQGWPGSGTSSNPYVISGFNISALSAIGIEIGNTTAHFVIRGCYIHDGYMQHDAIFLYNCVNGSVENNKCPHNIYGIYVKSSHNITIVNNTCTSGWRDGIMTHYAYSNILRNNTCSDGDGITLRYSNYTTVCDNHCSLGWGIDLYTSHNNILCNNTCNMKEMVGDVGISIQSSNNNILINNTCSNYTNGIFLGGSGGSHGNILCDNTCSWNAYYGISDKTSDTLIFNNTFESNSGYGICLGPSIDCKNNTIWNNTFHHNNGSGDVFNPLYIQASDLGTNNQWYSSAGYGNWWSDWTTPDNVIPWGIVDLPYNITGSSGAKDYYPRVGEILKYKSHLPISINGDDGFLGDNTSTGISTGSGTALDPYVIQGWEINAIGCSNAIDICNSDVHFKVINCHLHDATGTDPIGNGISLSYVTNGSLINNTCSNNDNSGIYLQSGSNYYLTGNNCSCNTYGIFAMDTDCNTFTNNTCSNNIESGISNFGDHNILCNNNCSGNSGFMSGIYLCGSNNNVSRNRLFSNDYSGIMIDGQYNDINNNTCRLNCDGIRPGYSSYNLIENNTLTDNSNGIYFDGGGSNIVRKNDCSNNFNGMRLDYDGGEIIIDNICSYNDADGIFTWDSSGNRISGNNCSNNGGAGINLAAYPWNNEVTNNVCNNNSGCGIASNGGYKYWNDKCIVGNECCWNGEDGIWSKNNGTDILNNSCISNNGHGIDLGSELLDGSTNCRIWNNTLSYNNGAGDTYDLSHVQAYDVGINNRWNSSSGYGNWWSDWRTPDEVAPWGVVELPYNIAGSAGARDCCPRTIVSLQITITAPTSNPTLSAGWYMIYLRGSAMDDVKVTLVTWSNSLGGSGIAYLTPQLGGQSVSWQSRGNVILHDGVNVITVTAYDNEGHVARATLTVTYNTPPTVTITAPTSNPTMTTSWHMINLRGTATDDSKVVWIAWTNSLGGSGAAYCTPQWGPSVSWQSRGNVLLYHGDNVITVTAYDNTGKTATDVITVTYTGY